MLLVHSPLLGPFSLEPLRMRAEQSGFDTALPDLTASVAADVDPGAAFARSAAAAAAELQPPIVVFGHSGAGVFLPSIGERLGESLSTLVFIDAVVPAPAGVHETSAELEVLLDSKTENAVLFPWSDWWPKADFDELVPDVSDREKLRSDMPRVRRSFYDEAVPLPPGWSDRHCVYLQLSKAYDADIQAARERAWPTEAIDANHLSPYSSPKLVLEAVRSLLGGHLSI